MDKEIQNAIVSGIERLSAWTNLLDQINVFPIADGDTGRNLKISLTPLLQIEKNNKNIPHQLLMSARGNSGNIASRFFSNFISAKKIDELQKAITNGSSEAWEAIHDPKEGTMLSIFKTLANHYNEREEIKHNKEFIDDIIRNLEEATKSTPQQLKKLEKAGVVDSGALGMFIFFEGFYRNLINNNDALEPITDRFGSLVEISSDFKSESEKGYCIDMVLKIDKDSKESLEKISEFGESVVILPGDDHVKVHLHADDSSIAKEHLKTLGNVVAWSEDNLQKQVSEFNYNNREKVVHIVTDAAGSVTSENAHLLNFSILESYINFGEKSVPETQIRPENLYSLMRKGFKASTSQASNFERYQSYESLLSMHEKILYLCVGSVFTGNYRVSAEWKKEHDKDDQLIIIDSGAASGRLGIIAISTARYAQNCDNYEDVVSHAEWAMENSEEYIFLQKLNYLAAGGRLSKTSAFFGDMLKMKPVVSPRPEGAEKVGVVRTIEEQILFAKEKTIEFININKTPLIMLEYTDNEEWVKTVIKKEIEALGPSDIIYQPLSHTTGVHTGPGTWAIAMLPQKL